MDRLRGADLGGGAPGARVPPPPPPPPPSGRIIKYSCVYCVPRVIITARNSAAGSYNVDQCTDRCGYTWGQLDAKSTSAGNQRKMPTQPKFLNGSVLIIDCPVLNWFNRVLNRFNTFPVSITQYRRGCVLQQHCCPIQISVKS